jgi:hypothetical protein
MYKIRINIFVLIFLLCSFRNNNHGTILDSNNEVLDIYNTVLSNLNKVYDKNLKFIYVNDSIFNPEADKWVTLSVSMLDRFKEKDIITIFKPNINYDKFRYKNKLDVPCFLKVVKTIKEGKKKVSLSNDGRIVSFSNINISSNNTLALVFVQVMGFEKIDYINTLIILEKIQGNWYIAFIKTYEMT